MSEQHIDRLNYYNGKRLVAGDFKLEQDYHIRVRRWLNKSLYSSGIARGLEVREDKGKPAVIVSPGLALDADGREIILLDEVRLDVIGFAARSPCGGPPGDGTYLTIQYDEHVAGDETDGCCPPATGNGNGSRAIAWGGPGIVRAEPILRWTDVLPSDGSNEVVLAQVSLKPGCQQVQSIDAGVRRYIGAASAAKVRQYALEGARDVHANPNDPDAHQRIYFHIRGRQATSVTLYLRGEKLPALYYTEMGQHTHTLTSQVQQADGRHRHALGSATTTTNGSHQHSLANQFAILEQPNDVMLELLGFAAGAIGNKTLINHKVVIAPRFHLDLGPLGSADFPPIMNNDAALGPMEVASSGSHSHSLTANQLTPDNDANSAHTHQVSSTAATAGVTDPTANSTKLYTAHSGAPLTYVADLQIWIDGTNQTDNIKRQLQSAIPTEQAQWARIGDGSKTHPFVTSGTRAIKLDFLPGLFFAEGEHVIELRVPPTMDAAGVPGPNGGRVNYNLYVE